MTCIIMSPAYPNKGLRHRVKALGKDLADGDDPSNAHRSHTTIPTEATWPWE